MKKIKIAEIGPYPPPNNGWSVRLKLLRDEFISAGNECKVLNIGENKHIKSPDYIDVQNGFDYIIKLFLLKVRGYHFHIHTNAQAVKGPLITLIALIISLVFFDRAAITFHGGLKQLYFPRQNAGSVFWLIYLNFVFPKVIICNDDAIKQKIFEYGYFISNNKIYAIPAFSVQYMNFIEPPLPYELDTFLKKKKYNIVSYLAIREGYYLETFIQFLDSIRTDVNVVITGAGEIEDKSMTTISRQFNNFKQKGKIYLTNDLDHDQFLTLLKRCDLYLRTYISDGVSSAVLEALSLGTKVVASDNGRRPEGVITFDPRDVNDLQEKVYLALDKKDEENTEAGKPEIRNTLIDELLLLQNTFN